jgi:NADH dehydrogenase [ubiquinone] 1 alpha subcomplex assembly factor 1
MPAIILFLASMLLPTTMILFDFNTQSTITNWQIVDDAVMGGRSSSSFALNKAGLGVFEGVVSLENNGGFSMVQYRFDAKKVNAFSNLCVKLKGDGKAYQFRIKTNARDSHSYIASFNTTGEWQTIEIPFETMYPAYRGRTLSMENYPGEQMEMIAFLIGNKKAEPFKLEIDSIVLK